MGAFRTKLKIDFAGLKDLRGSVRTLQLGVVSFAGLQIAKQLHGSSSGFLFCNPAHS